MAIEPLEKLDFATPLLPNNSNEPAEAAAIVARELMKVQDKLNELIAVVNEMQEQEAIRRNPEL